MSNEGKIAPGNFRTMALRIWPSAAVIGIGLMLTAFAIMDHLLDPDFHPPWYRDERLWWVGLGVAWSWAGIARARHLFGNFSPD
jgi:hypothetical protein